MPASKTPRTDEIATKAQSERWYGYKSMLHFEYIALARTLELELSAAADAREAVAWMRDAGGGRHAITTRPTNPDDWTPLYAHPPAPSGMAVVPVELIEKLGAWDKKYPKGRVYNGSEFRQCESELDEIIDALLASAARGGK